jgi:cytochrome P450
VSQVVALAAAFFVLCVFAAGYDTSSSAITWMLNQLALKPHIMQQVRHCTFL